MMNLAVYIIKKYSRHYSHTQFPVNGMCLQETECWCNLQGNKKNIKNYEIIT